MDKKLKKQAKVVRDKFEADLIYLKIKHGYLYWLFLPKLYIQLYKDLKAIKENKHGE